MVVYKGLSSEHTIQALQNDLVAGRDPRTGGYIDNDYMDWLRRTSPELFQDPSPTDDKKWKPKPGTDPLTGMPLAQGGSPYQEYKPGNLPPTMKEEKELYERYKQITNPQPPTEEQLGLPIELAGASFEIDPAGHKKAGKKQKIYNKATDKGASGSEKDWIQKTGPQLPLAQGLPPVLGERDAVIQRADALRKAGKIDEALDLYRHAATLPTPTV